MGLNVTSDDKGIKVYRKDRETKSGGTFATYSLAISSKDASGNWINGYMDAKFKKGVEVNNKAKIKINNAFFTVDEYNGKTYPKIFVLDFDVIEQGEVSNINGDAFVNLDSNDLPDFMKIDDAVGEEVPFK